MLPHRHIFRQYTAQLAAKTTPASDLPAAADKPATKRLPREAPSKPAVAISVETIKISSNQPSTQAFHPINFKRKRRRSKNEHHTDRKGAGNRPCHARAN